MTKKKPPTRLDYARERQEIEPLTADEYNSIATDLAAVMNKHGWDAVLLYMADFGDKPMTTRKPTAGRPPAWNPDALMCMWLVVELELRRARKRAEPAPTVLGVMKAHFQGRHSKPLLVAPGVKVLSPETAARRYTQALQIMEGSPASAGRWQTMAAEVERSIERLGWPKIMMDRLHLLSAERQLARLGKRRIGGN